MTPKSQKDSETASKPDYYGYSYGYGDLAEGDRELGGGLSLTDIISLIRRRWELITVFAVIGTLAASVWSHIQTPVYSATAQLLIEPEHRVVDLDSVVEGIGSDAAAIETQLSFFKSLGFLEGFVATYLQGSGSTNETSESLASLKDADQDTPGKINAAHAAEADAVPNISRKAAEIASNLTVSQAGRSFIINVNYTSTSPNQAAEIANELAAYYIVDQANRRRDVTSDASGFLERRLRELEADLLAAEEALHQYRIQNPTGTQATAAETTRRLSDIGSLLVQTRAERKEKEVRLGYMKGLKKKGAKLDSLTEVLSSPYMASLWDEDSALRNREAELRLELGDNHPKIVALNEERVELRNRIDTEVDKIIDNATNELQVLAQREKSLEADIGKLSEIASNAEAQTNHAAIRLRLLEGKANSSRRIYEEFLIRLKQTREQEAVVQANTRLIASAKTPTSPKNGSTVRFLLLGLVGSSAIGFGFAFLLDKLDRRLRTGKDIAQKLNVPCLGLVPFVSKKARENQKLTAYLASKRISRFAEALRSIYTQLIMTDKAEEPRKVFQVTSSVPDEGKTTIAVNLATLLALDGKKVLLLDLDLRNPSVHREVDLEDARSISSFLRGKKELDSSMRAELDTGCHVMALKSRLKNPGKVLQSPRLKELIEVARSSYEYVIIDGPPSLGLSDSKTLLPLADALIFVVRWNHTNADHVSEAIDELKRCKAEIAGAVLTQVDLGKQKRYGQPNGSSYYSKNSNYYSD